ncbi:hypothetical protein CN354_16250 [Bacillus cereus]|nr:hypothetical protein CN354_16250 [Bacillus cereus]
MFGPSRYISYQNVDILQYRTCHNLDGGKTTYAMKNWFDLYEDPIFFEKISGKLIDYLAQFDLDIRRNPEKLPSFQLNSLKEDIPKLEQLYLSNEVLIDDTTVCQTCHKSFHEEPFYAHNERYIPICLYLTFHTLAWLPLTILPDLLSKSFYTLTFINLVA